MHSVIISRRDWHVLPSNDCLQFKNLLARSLDCNGFNLVFRKNNTVCDCRSDFPRPVQFDEFILIDAWVAKVALNERVQNDVVLRSCVYKQLGSRAVSHQKYVCRRDVFFDHLQTTGNRILIEVLWNIKWNQKRRHLHHAALKCINDFSLRPHSPGLNFASHIQKPFEVRSGLEVFRVTNPSLHTLNRLAELSLEAHEDAFLQLVLDCRDTIDFRRRFCAASGQRCRRKERADLQLSDARHKLVQLEEIIHVSRKILLNDLIPLGNKCNRVMNSQRSGTHLRVRSLLQKQKPLDVRIVHHKVPRFINRNVRVVQVSPGTSRTHQPSAADLNGKQRERLRHRVVSINLRADLIAGFVIEQVTTDLAVRLLDEDLAEFDVLRVVLVGRTVASLTQPVLIPSCVVIRVKRPPGWDGVVDSLDEVVDVPPGSGRKLRVF